MDSGRNKPKSVLIQDRSRLYRESLSLVLGSLFAWEVLGTVPDGQGLLSVWRNFRIDSVVIEGDGVPWDVQGLVSHIIELTPSVTIVCTSCDHRGPKSMPNVHRMSRTAPGRAFEDCLRGRPHGRGGELPYETSSTPGPNGLTPREMQVLALISSGRTTMQISDRLGISVKTVENRRQAIFAKLGVQNQSHAVSVAIRAGLLGASVPHIDS